MSWALYNAIIRDFLYEINRAIIVDKYEWKVPFFGGHIRISKKEVKDKEGNFVRWWYHWKWDKRRNIMHWPKSSMWTFVPVEGRCARRGVADKDIGEYGLIEHIREMGSNYDVMLKARPIKRISFKEFVGSLNNVD